MATNVLQFIYNADGSILDKVNPFIASNNQAANNVQIISPFPASDSVAVNYYLRNARISNYTQYARLLKDTSGNIVYAKDIVSPSKPYYQIVKDWNVWQIPISSKALRAISKYHAGKVDLSVTFREFKNFLIDETMEFKGTFGSAKSTTRGDIPLTANDGDYYRCDYLDFHSNNSNLDFTLMDLAIWDEINSRWIKGSSYEEALPTPSTEVGVDPSVFGMAIEDVEPSVTEQILDRISDLESILLGELPEEVLANMFVRKNLELYYAELSFLQTGDKLYVERNGQSYVIDASDLPIHMDVLEDVDYLTFNKNYTPPEKLDGMLYYDNTGGKQTLTFVNTYSNGQTQEVNIGQEVYTIGKNLNGTLFDGQPVSLSGIQGDHVTYLPANASSLTPNLNEVIGVLSTTVQSNDYGPVVVFGMVDEIDLSKVMETGTDLDDIVFGSKLYLSATQDGKYSLTIPEVPNEAIWVATVMSFNIQKKNARLWIYPTRLRLDSQLIQDMEDLKNQVEDLENQMPLKADLVLGKVPLHQLPLAVQNTVIVTQDEAPIDPITNAYWIDTEGLIEDPIMSMGFNAFSTEPTGDLTAFSSDPEEVDTSGDIAAFDLNPEEVDTSGDIEAFDLDTEEIDTSGDTTSYTSTSSGYDENGNFIG